MVRFLHPMRICRSRDLPGLALAICWIGGLLCSGVVYSASDSSFALLFSSGSCAPAAFTAMFFAALVPWVLSWAVIFSGHPRWLYVVCFGKALLYGYLCCAIQSSYGSAGWLVRFLFLFEDTLGNVFLYLFWSRRLRRGFFHPFIGIPAAVLLTGIITAADYCCISPLLHHSLF